MALSRRKYRPPLGGRIAGQIWVLETTGPRRLGRGYEVVGSWQLCVALPRRLSGEE
jgi:hypothetical protein